MNITIESVADLGLAIRAVRRSAKVRLDDLAAVAGLSKQFTSDVEYGKSTVQLGLVLKLLAELGIPLQLDIPLDANAEFIALQRQGGASNSQGKMVAAKRRTPSNKGIPQNDLTATSLPQVTVDADKAKGDSDAKS